MIAIVDYNAGNLTSVKLALDYLGVRSEITRSPARILAADRVIFPGVGSAGAAMENIRTLGLADVLRQVVQRGTPFLGICLGPRLFSRLPKKTAACRAKPNMPISGLHRLSPVTTWRPPSFTPKNRGGWVCRS